jgi:N-methylhydantoinase B
MAIIESPIPAWDPAVDGYIGPETVSTTIPLHRETDPNIDAISYEVIRHALWNINIEHGETILKVSGSPVALYSHDFNPAITTEDGELVYFGQYVQHLCAGAPAGVKWTLENRDRNPGIEDGDIYLTNDPWIACNHQQDVVMLKPVFWEGAVFAWVTSTLHQYDLGGTTPGSFCPDAKDAFSEPSAIPPIRIVRGNEISADVEEMVLRKSRLPEMVRLDLRAMIAGCNIAERRLLEQCEKYGAPVVKGAMKRISDNSEQVFLARLADIPDGVWRDRSYLEMSLPGDMNIYEIALSLTKEGNTLTFSNEGTDPQAGAINTTIVGFKGAIMTGLIAAFLHDQLFAYGGPMRHIRFEPVAGTLTCAGYPASVSCAPNTSMLTVLAQANAVISKMISCSRNPADRREATAKFGASQYPILSLSGLDRRDGGSFATVLLDPMMSGIGAFEHRDGVSTGGYPFDPKAIAPNVEFNEQFFPILYLHRRELVDSAGPGRHRGGAAASWAFVPHGTDVIDLATSASGVWVPTGTGMWGGGAASTTRFTLKRHSDALEQFAAGSLPTDLVDLEGEEGSISPKSIGLRQETGDALEIRYPGAAGFGDPLEREPQSVADDVSEGYVSIKGAKADYGVIVVEIGPEVWGVDTVATSSHRDEVRARRRCDSVPAIRGLKGPPTRGTGQVELADLVRITFEDGRTVFACQACETVLGCGLTSYKEGTVVRDVELIDAVPGFVPGESAAAHELVHREHSCPSCLRRMSAEVVRRQDPSLVDVEIWSPPEGHEG